MSKRSKTSPIRINAAERRIKALELRRAGATYKQISQQLGCSEQRAHQIITKELARIEEELAEGRNATVRLELERLDRLWLGAWPRAREGDEKAINACLQIMARRSKLLGLDTPEQHQHNVVFRDEHHDDI